MELEKEGMKNKEKRKRRKPKWTEENTSSWWSFEVLGLFWLRLHFTSVMPVSSGSTQIVGSSVRLIWQALSSHVLAWWSPKYSSFGTECSQMLLVPDALWGLVISGSFPCFHTQHWCSPPVQKIPKKREESHSGKAQCREFPNLPLLGVGGHTWPL